MVDYSHGKIYKIEPIVEHDEGDIYVGSTTKHYLSQRMDKHIYDYKRYKEEKCSFITSFKLFDKYGVENCKIILLELCSNISTKDELLSREQHYIQSVKCVNKARRSENYKKIIRPKLVCSCGMTYTSNNKKLHDKSLHHKKYAKPVINNNMDMIGELCDSMIELTEDKKDKLSIDEVIYYTCKENPKTFCIDVKDVIKYLKEKYQANWNHDIRFGKSRGGFFKMRLKVDTNIEIEDDEEELKELEKELEELMKK
jgi:predicted Zn-ribbon and HTH transcriptional regulator